MKTINLLQTGTLAAILFFTVSCQKDAGIEQPSKAGVKSASVNAATPPFNLEVILHGEGKQFGLVKFRQDVEPAKIVTLDTWVRDLMPNHEYLLQRALDNPDGNCTSTTWLTLGKGLTPQSILTDDQGMGKENLWRDLSAIPSGTAFDIHFRVVDKTSMAVVLDSDCYQYVVR